MLHRAVDDPESRTTVISANSMTGHAGVMLGGLALGTLATATILTTVLLVGAAIAAAAALGGGRGLAEFGSQTAESG